MHAILNTVAYAWDMALVFHVLIAFLEPDYTVPCRQTMMAGENVERSSSLPLWDPVLSGESCHQNRCLDSVDYGVVPDRDCSLFYWLGRAMCDPVDPLNTREAHCGTHEYSWNENICFTVYVKWNGFIY